MLRITFVNDGTGNEISGHYHYTVEINYQVVTKGKLTNHNRPLGWQELVRHFVTELQSQVEANLDERQSSEIAKIE